MRNCREEVLLLRLKIPSSCYLDAFESEFSLFFSSPMVFCKSTEVSRTGDAPALVSDEEKLSKGAEHLPCADPTGGSLRTGCSQWKWNPGSLGKSFKKKPGLDKH